MEQTTAQDARPELAAGRLLLLDVLRGTAILGTLATNVWIFTNPGGEAAVIANLDSVASFSGGGGSTVGVVLETTFRFLANGKFLALLTMLFGVGLAIQHTSAQRRGVAWPRGYRWRGLLLLAEGSLHFLLVFAFDVLMGYAVTALLVAWLLGRSVRAQNVTMYIAAGLHVALMALLTVGQLANSNVAATPTRDPLFTSGSYVEQVQFRIDNLLVLRAEPILSFGLLVALFLLGVRLFRAGAFGADPRGRLIRRRLTLVGLGAGLPLNLAATLAGPDLYFLDRYVCAPLTALGYLGLVGLLLDRVAGRAPGPLLSGVSAVGRTALTSYVTQNLICAFICYGWGLGLAARLDGARPWWTLVMWTAVCALLLAGARLWLRCFGQGPLEAMQHQLLRRLVKA